ncbi:MAG: hypothetical protein JXB47_15385 [Anaerolineae bacterium]|nr:hypothetical protein [Anaerolineae bacterium]
MSEQSQSHLLNSTLIRVMIAVVALAAVVVCVVFVVLNTALAARRQPIEIEPYPGAQLVAQEDVGVGQDRLLYTTQDAADRVADFYRERYHKDEFQKCERHDAPTNADGSLVYPDEPAFEVMCSIDNSTINAQHSAVIIIQPHTAGPYAGLTVIDIRRAWQE